MSGALSVNDAPHKYALLQFLAGKFMGVSQKKAEEVSEQSVNTHRKRKLGDDEEESGGGKSEAKEISVGEIESKRFKKAHRTEEAGDNKIQCEELGDMMSLSQQRINTLEAQVTNYKLKVERLHVQHASKDRMNLAKFTQDLSTLSEELRKKNDQFDKAIEKVVILRVEANESKKSLLGKQKELEEAKEALAHQDWQYKRNKRAFSRNNSKKLIKAEKKLASCEEKIIKALECRICFEKYNNGSESIETMEDRRPVIMPGNCGRTVCRSCAERGRAAKIEDLSGNAKMIPCMFCGCKYHSEKHQFPTNRDLLALL